MPLFKRAFLFYIAVFKIHRVRKSPDGYQILFVSRESEYIVKKTSVPQTKSIVYFQMILKCVGKYLRMVRQTIPADPSTTRMTCLFEEQIKGAASPKIQTWDFVSNFTITK